VLIHEATFGCGKEEEAVGKKHSTVDEALAVARAMRAACVILTHFSQRWADRYGQLILV
jgi:ribonuclease Z